MICFVDSVIYLPKLAHNFAFLFSQEQKTTTNTHPHIYDYHIYVGVFFFSGMEFCGHFSVRTLMIRTSLQLDLSSLTLTNLDPLNRTLRYNQNFSRPPMLNRSVFFIKVNDVGHYDASVQNRVSKHFILTNSHRNQQYV